MNVGDLQRTDSPSKSSPRNVRDSPSRTLQSDAHAAPAAIQQHPLTEPPANRIPLAEIVQSEQTFQPFFTLIQDNVTHEHHHPIVHYVFADDDTDVLTEAACRSIELADSERSMEDTKVEYRTGGERDTTGSASKEVQPRSGAREHYLILDVHPVSMDADMTAAANVGSDRLSSPGPGSFETARNASSQRSSKTYPYPYMVAGVHSLSTDWQVTQATITDAPTMNGDSDAATQDNFMLKISGSSNVAESQAMGRRDDESLEKAIERFQRRLDEIRRLIQMDEAIHEVEEDIESGQGLLHQAGINFGTGVLDEQD